MNPDPEIDQLLSALRDTTPPDGMNSRLLQNLTQPTDRVPHVSLLGHGFPQIFKRSIPGAPFMTRLLRHGWGTLPIAAALATAALILALAGSHRHTTSSATATLDTPTPSSRPDSPSAASTRSPRPETAHFAAAAERPAVSTTHPSPLPQTAHSGPWTLDPQPSPRRVLCDCDPLALADSEAPSHPAPPLPLTAQERLLRRMARPDSPVLLAELDQRARELDIDRLRLEVRQLFATLAPSLTQPSESQPPQQPETTTTPDPQPNPIDSSTPEPTQNGDPQ